MIGQHKADWNSLSTTQQRDFIARVGRTVTALGLVPVIGYRLTSAPGTFIEVWESGDKSDVERAVKNLEAMEYTRYVEARWLTGEREETQP